MVYAYIRKNIRLLQTLGLAQTHMILKFYGFYNSPVQSWIDTLSSDMQTTINEGIKGHGPLKNFPNYSTIDQEWFQLVELSAPQVSTIADMFAWSIEQNANIFNPMLTTIPHQDDDVK